ncbi:MAG: MYXO-CTERM sorting domain-containing protein [Pseudomonadota bacterium]|nr:MYXO-CTERM sorting domain-containing protein [Pseudomonadota bacterium]
MLVLLLSAPFWSALAAPPVEAEQLFEAFATQGERREPVALAGSGARYLDVYKSGDLAILHDADGEWFAEALSQGGDPLAWMLGSLETAFYKKFDDDYQYLTVLLVKDFGFFAAFYSPIANDVYGIGYDSMFAGEEFDLSSNQLDGFIFMNYYGLWTESPDVGRYVFGQEFMHRWGSFVNIEKEGLDQNALLGRDTAHWSYYLNTPNSPMEGNTWSDNADGTWSTENTSVSTYSDLDLYLMGLVGPEDVGVQTLLLVDQADAEGTEAATTPEFLDRFSGGRNVTLTATPVTFTVDDIIAAEGARVPSVENSPKNFRMAFLVLVLSEDTFGEAEIATIDQVRQTWEADWEEDVGYLADLDTTLGNSTAPTWGEPTDTGGEDTGDIIDCCKDDGETEETPAACGCASTGAPGGTALLALALVGLLGARRERRS